MGDEYALRREWPAAEYSLNTSAKRTDHWRKTHTLSPQSRNEFKKTCHRQDPHPRHNH